MNRRFLSSLLVVTGIGGQLLHAQAPTTVASVAAANEEKANVQAPADLDALGQLRARITAQQEQIKKLQQAVDEQQKMLEQTLAKTSVAATPSTVIAAKTVTTEDGTSLVTASNSGTPVKLVPAVDKRPDIVNMPRSMQKDASVIPSPLGISIGNSTFTPFGFVDAILYGRSSNPGTGLGTGFAGIPYNNAITNHISEQNISIQNSRLGFRVDSSYKGAKVLGYLEMDFIGNQSASVFQTSNSNTFRMRNAFVDIQKGKFEFLAGQDWSMFTSNRKGISPIPSDVFFSQAVDTNYQAGLVWTRQAQFRFVYHPSESVAMGLSFENPQQYIGGAFVTLPAAFTTTTSAANGQLTNQLNNGASNFTVPNVFPDILVKVAADSKVFHIEAGGMVRQFKIDTGLGTPVLYTTHSATGYAGTVNLNVNLNNRFRLLANTYFGDGGGRYIGGTAPDLIVRANGSLAPVHSYSTTDGFEINPTKNSLFYGYYSGVLVGRDTTLDTNGKLIGYGFVGSSLADNKTIQEATFGYSPTFWKSPQYGSFSMNFQYSYLLRDPWSIPAAGPRNTHASLYYIDIRYTLP